MKIPAARISFTSEDRKSILVDIDSVLQSGWLTLGHHTEEFEADFSRYMGAKYSVAVNSGTSALEIPLRYWDVRDKEVIVPANTFFATAAAVVHAGGIPRFADIDANTFALSRDALENVISDKTAGIIIVHIGGMIAPWIRDLRALCDKRNLFLLEDAAHAHGSSHDDKRAGTFGHAAAFSFYPTKNMTSGEGGMIVTDDEELCRQARGYRDQGKADFNSNFHTVMGYNWRMSELHAILGKSQLRRLDEANAARYSVASSYDQALLSIPGINSVLVPPGGRSSVYKYMALLDPGIDRAELKRALRERYEVSLSGEVYETPCHLQPVFAEYNEGSFPVAEDVCARHICLPIFNNMSAEESEHVTSSLANVLEEQW